MSHKILIVDDEPGIRDSMKEYFEIQDLSAAIAECGEQAIDLAKIDTFDVILSDLRMPRGDGRFLLRKIKEINVFKPVFFLMSGFTDLTVEQACAEGAASLFTKPINPIEILKTVRRFLLPPQERWKLTPDFKSTIQFQISGTPNDACKQKLCSFGHLGLYVATQAELPKVNELIEIRFSEDDCLVRGVVKWTRDGKQSKLPSGYGIEYLQMSPSYLKLHEDYMAQTKPIAAIPNS